MASRERGWEEVRVFVSSTFRDMQAERDHLVKVVFPELRERLEKHRIYFVDIDLRWGVTQDQSDNDEALELCLEEIDRCRPEEGDRRPFFIGILGERYGWVPETVRPEVLKRYDWIPDYPEHSVTALEIIHGVLLNPPMHGQSFFYFRDPEATGDIPEEAARAGAYREFATEEEIEEHGEEQAERLPRERERKLAELKQRIRESGIPLMEDYPCEYAGLRINWRLAAQELDEVHRRALAAVAEDNVVAPEEWEGLSAELQAAVAEHGTVALDGLEAFGEQVREDLLWGIAQQYPEILEEPVTVEVEEEDALAVEQDFHDRFAESRLRIYVGRDEGHGELAQYLDGEAQEPLVLVGPSGCGKSAILARLYTDYAEKDSDTFVLPHFVGASAASTSVASMLRRLCQELQDHFGFPGEMPDDPTELPGTFRMFLGMLPEGGRAAVIIDALDQLDERDRETGLHWLPSEFPANVKLLVSCLDDVGNREVLEELQERGHPVVRVEPLTEADCKQIIEKVPSLSAKTLDKHQRSLLLSNPATRNALYLQVALEELRGFGSFDQLNARIAQFDEAEDVTALFGQVLERLELDFGQSLVEELTCLLAASRAGLTERELADLLTETDRRGELQVVLRQLRSYLLRRDELVDYYHLALDRAVVARYQAGEDDARWHIRLADYFETAELGPRKLEELPWQLAQAKAWRRLYDLLADLEFFHAAWGGDDFEVRAYWAQVEASSDLEMVEAYRPVLDTPEKYDVWSVAELLQATGHLLEALSLREHLVGHYRQQAASAGLATSLGNQANILHARGDLDGAMALHKEEERICRKLGSRDRLSTSLGNQAVILKIRGDLDRAMALHKEEELMWRELGNKDGLQRTLGNQALICYTWGDLDGAMALMTKQERICRELGDKDGLSRALGNQALVLHSRRDLDRAILLMKEQERICRELGSKDGLHTSLGNQGRILQALGDLDGAMALHKEAERICRELGSKDGLHICLGNQALILKARGDLDGAMALHKEAERVCRELGSKEGLHICLGNQALILKARGDLDGAMALLREKECICRELNTPDWLARTLVSRARLLLKEMGRPQEALPLADEAERLVTEHGLHALAEQIKPILDRVRSAQH